MAEFPIPEGYYLLGPVNTKNAKQALAEAEENGFGPETVQTRHDGFLIPLPADEVVSDGDTEWVIAHSPNPDRLGLILSSPDEGEEDEEVVSREDFERDDDGDQERAAEAEAEREREAQEREQAERAEAERVAAKAEAERVEAERVAAEAAEAEKNVDTDAEKNVDTEAEKTPDDSWLKVDIENWAKDHNIDATGNKADILGRINDTLEVK